MLPTLLTTLLLGLSHPAHATAGFDPTTPAERFVGRETWTIEEDILLWSAIERLEDPDRTLLVQEDFNDGLAWPSGASWAPWISDCFGTATPSSDAVLMHIGPNYSYASGTPILFVPGAGDNASRGFVTMAYRMNNNFRPVFALTFAHPHGDVFRHAEQVANAISRIKSLTGAPQVDVVSHSKGGIAAAVYLSNLEGTNWDRTDYESVGTRYRGDVRKAVFIAVPLGGVDTMYRWSSGNYMGLDADTAISPTSWGTYYPYTTAVLWDSVDLGQQDHLPANGDLFPGQRQLLRRWDDVYPLPGESPQLGSYSLQQDWYTTYYGGYGYVSHSDGIDAAIAAGDNVLDNLVAAGVHPDIELYVLAGTNPLMPNGADDYLAGSFDAAWADVLTDSVEAWGDLTGSIVGESWAEFGISEDEVAGLAQGKLVLGEVTGPSDGLVFVDSALYTDALTARGAVVVEATTRNLSHLDLLYASPITGELLQEQAALDPITNGWMNAFGARYIEADTLGWVEAALADEAGGDSGGTGGSGGDGGSDGGGDGGGDGTGGGGADGEVDGDTTGPTPGWDPAGDKGGCAVASSSWTPGLLGGLLVLAGRRRTRRTGRQTNG